MAVIQKLRNSGIVIVVIIAALILFVVGDILTSNRTGLAGEDRDLAGMVFDQKIKEKDVSPVADEIYKRMTENNPEFKFDESSRKQILEQAWSTLIRRLTYEKEIAKAGIEISDADFNEMVAGEHPVEAIKGDPSFQTDNRFDPKKVEQIFKQAKTNASLRGRVNEYAKSLKQQEVEKRYTTYISKAQVKSKIEKEYEFIAANQGANGKLVVLNYSSVPDKDIKVTDEDLEKYLEEHKEEYRQAFDSRDIQYVVWEIIPSAEDSAFTKMEAERLHKSWMNETDPDTSGPDVTGFSYLRDIATDSTLVARYAPLFASPKNAVMPLTVIDGKYTLLQKLDEQKDTADPYVKVAHILIPLTGELPNKTMIKDSVQAEAQAYELLGRINSGASLGDLAKDYSADPGSASNKGEYDWAKASKYVPAFGKFCATHLKGQTGVVRTEFGFHVMKMLENPDYLKVKFRKKEMEVMPGSETIRKVDESSRRFKNTVIAGDVKSFETNRDKMGLQPRIKKDIKTDDRNIPGIEKTEDVKTLLSWLFDKDRKQNDISDVFAFSTRHLVVLVSNVRNRGYAKVSDVREKIEPLVRNELKAKKIAEKFAKHSGSAKSAEELAQKVGGSVIPLESVKLGSNFIPQLFTEQRILGAAFGVKEKSWSKPVAGNNVVAVIWIDSRDKIEIPKTGVDQGEDFANNPQFLSSRIQEIIRMEAEIQDFRYKFNWD